MPRNPGKPGRKPRRPRRSFWGVGLITIGLVIALIRLQDTPWDFFSSGTGRDLVEVGKSLEDRLERTLSGDSPAEESKPKGEITIRWSKDRDQAPPADKEPSIQIIRKSESPRPSRQPTGPAKKSLDRGVVLVRGVSKDRSLTADGLFLSGRKAGHGFVVRTDRSMVLIVTAAHVLRGALPEVRETPDGPFLPAELVELDTASDLALLRISKRALPRAAALPLDKAARLQAGRECWVVNAENEVALVEGEALGRTEKARLWISESLGPDRAAADWFLVSQAGHEGLSGAPVLSRSGKVAGVLIGGIELPDASDVSIVMGSKAIQALLQ